MIEPLIRCDVVGCQSVKKDANRWWVLNFDGAKMTTSKAFYSMPWHEASPEEIRDGLHACSRSCAQKIFERCMTATEQPDRKSSI